MSILGGSDHKSFTRLAAQAAIALLDGETVENVKLRFGVNPNGNMLKQIADCKDNPERTAQAKKMWADTLIRSTEP